MPSSSAGEGGLLGVRQRASRPDPNTWLSRIYDEKGTEGGAGNGPGGGHSGGGSTVDGEPVDPVLGRPNRFSFLYLPRRYPTGDR